MILVERAFDSVIRLRSEMRDREVAARLLTSLMLLPPIALVRLCRWLWGSIQHAK